METSKRNIYRVLVIFSLLFALGGCSSDDDEQQESKVPTFKSTSNNIFRPLGDGGNGEYIDNVWYNTVRCSANITDNGGSAIIEYGFCWVENNTETPTVEKGNKIKVGTSDITGDYSADILVKTGKFYHVRAYARNSSGVGYGELKSAFGGSLSPR